MVGFISWGSSGASELNTKVAAEGWVETDDELLESEGMSILSPVLGSI